MGHHFLLISSILLMFLLSACFALSGTITRSFNGTSFDVQTTTGTSSKCTIKLNQNTAIFAQGVSLASGMSVSWNGTGDCSSYYVATSIIIASSPVTFSPVSSNTLPPAPSTTLPRTTQTPLPPPPQTTSVQSPTTCVSGFGSWSSNNLPPACYAPYSSSSQWTVPLPQNARLSPNDAALVNWFLTYGQTGFSTTARLNVHPGNDYSHPIYFSSSSDPIYTIRCAYGKENAGIGKNDWGTCQLDGLKIRLPSKASPAGGTDHHMGIVDQTADMEYDFWGACSTANGDLVPNQSNGEAPGVSECIQSDGFYWVRFGSYGSFRNGTGFGSHATAGGAQLWGGFIRSIEWQYAAENNISLPHALFIGLSCVNADKVVYLPSTGHADTLCPSGVIAPHYGQRLWLDMPDTEIDALSIPSWKKVIYRTLVHHGAIPISASGNYGQSFTVESVAMYLAYNIPNPSIAFAKSIGISAASDGSYFLDWSTPLVDLSTKLHWLDWCVPGVDNWC